MAARTLLRKAHPEAASFAGGEGRALILDTEGTFRPERIMEISKRFDLNGEDVLNNIRVSRVRCLVTRTRPPSQRVWQQPMGTLSGVPQVHTPDINLPRTPPSGIAIIIADLTLPYLLLGIVDGGQTGASQRRPAVSLALSASLS